MLNIDLIWEAADLWARLNNLAKKFPHMPKGQRAYVLRGRALARWERREKLLKVHAEPIAADFRQR